MNLLITGTDALFIKLYSDSALFILFFMWVISKHKNETPNIHQKIMSKAEKRTWPLTQSYVHVFLCFYSCIYYLMMFFLDIYYYIIFIFTLCSLAFLAGSCGTVYHALWFGSVCSPAPLRTFNFEKMYNHILDEFKLKIRDKMFR